MADTIKVSALPVATTSAAADSIPIVQGGVTKIIHPGPAGGLDAGTVSGYGIGVSASPQMATSLDNYRTSGFFYDPGNLTNSPNGVNAASIIVIAEQNTAWVSQFAIFRFASAGIVFKIRRFNTTWGAWETVWTPTSDGNGGQPPAPKPTSGTPAGGADAPGQYYSGSVSNASIYNAGPVSKATGQWEFSCTTFVSATGVIVAAKTINRIGNGYDGFFVSASETCVYDARRIS
jgi:hypothetical protein